ncbi:MAG: hypothetical protein CL811_01230 [Colwelliaceae bacterium]|nr:hypothetical protein [Colwelliaceae bacterium]|tara:strand:- start:865 stop:1245 length:381 start_codon:yes stop_codon:yes gene_type:complete
MTLDSPAPHYIQEARRYVLEDQKVLEKRYGSDTKLAIRGREVLSSQEDGEERDALAARTYTNHGSKGIVILSVNDARSSREGLNFSSSQEDGRKKIEKHRMGGLALNDDYYNWDIPSEDKPSGSSW